MSPIQKWHNAIHNRDLSLLDELLAEEVVFHSPVVWTPQEGKALTTMYLTAAFYVLGGEDFKYAKEIVADKQACLEFNTKIDDTVINGVDIITFNDTGQIIEFKVMVRPLRAINTLKEKMFELMQTMTKQK